MSKKRVRYQMGVFVIVASLAYMLLQGAHNFSSYFVSVKVYRAHLAKFRDQTIRVQGLLESNSVRYNPHKAVLSFVLADGSSAIAVMYRGAMPNERFRNADAIVKGRMGPQGVFDAQKLEIQCPNHYAPAKEVQ